MEIPDDDARTVVIGKTGSGKTRFGVWLLAMSSIQDMPWIIINSKGDKFINQIPYAKRIKVTDAIPRRAGVYIVSPMPDDPRMEGFLERIWRKGKTGIFIDEGYMLADSMWLNRLLTQGRSKLIPIIICTQRPVWLPRFTFSEAFYISYFGLSDDRDIDTVQRFVDTDLFASKALLKQNKYHSIWYDIGNDTVEYLKPCPTDDQVMDIFKRKLDPDIKNRETGRIIHV